MCAFHKERGSGAISGGLEGLGFAGPGPVVVATHRSHCRGSENQNALFGD